VGEDTLATSRLSNRLSGVNTMRWEMPQAVDFRFGMEITMYIANR
jgi:coenzyme PQQ precursor peptide PqqA